MNPIIYIIGKSFKLNVTDLLTTICTEMFYNTNKQLCKVWSID